MQVRLRTLLVVVAMIAIALSLLSQKRRFIARRLEAVHLMGFGRGVDTSQPAWHKALFGDDSPAFVDEITLGLVDLNERQIDHVNGFALLSTLTSVRKLHIAGRLTTNNDFRMICKMQNLRSLVLEDARNISDVGLVYIGELKHLERLKLHKAIIGRVGAVQIGKVTSLQSLTLSSASISDEEVIQLSTLTNLRELDLSGTNATEKGVEALRRALPQLEHVYEFTNQQSATKQR